MSGTTPTYGFPYQTLGDAPNGAQGLQDLATAVETQLVRKDTGFAIHIRTTAGTANFVKPTSPAAKFHCVRLWGAGGQGGGTTGAGAGLSEGGGGQGGDYVEKWYLDSALSASEPYTVGAGGSSGGAGANGQNGGNSTFKALTANGGVGGTAMTSNTTSQGALGGRGGSAPAGGDLMCKGDDGGFGRTILGVPCFTNYGGGSPGGGGQTQQTDLVASAGTAGQSPGGGGSGSFSSTVSFAGGAGAAGKIMIISFY